MNKWGNGYITKSTLISATCGVILTLFKQFRNIECSLIKILIIYKETLMGKHDVIEPKYFKAVGGKERESDRERESGWGELERHRV